MENDHVRAIALVFLVLFSIIFFPEIVGNIIVMGASYIGEDIPNLPIWWIGFIGIGISFMILFILGWIYIICYDIMKNRKSLRDFIGPVVWDEEQKKWIDSGRKYER